MHVDYMSSENTASGGEENEEDEDDGQKIVTVHKLPWCSKKVTELFSNLDARTKVNGWKTGRVSKKVFDNIQTLWHCNYNNKGNIEATARKLRLPFYIMPAPMRNLGMIIVQRAPTAGNDDGVLGHAAFRSSWLYSNKGLSPTETSEYTTANTNGIKTPENVNVGGVANLDKQLKSISELSREFALRTTSHGVARIAESTNRCSKLLWISVVFIAFGAFTGQLIALIITFLEYPVIINIDVVSRNTLPFPAVTICNTNKVRKSAVLESRYNALLDIDDFRERRAYLTYMGPCIPGDVPCDVDENQCVKSYMKCNGINDCPNGGDEAVCNYGECFEGEFQCPNGKCIPASSQCDYRNDCEDNTDEEDCSFPSCADNEFTCTNHQCMSVSLVCDGNADCYDGSDELIGEHCLYPGSVCSPDFFRCTNGECIHYTLRCDQYADCSDSSDESECQHSVCPVGFFQCRLFSQCIPQAAECDGKDHCLDHTDEYPCPDKPLLPNGCNAENMFACDSGSCINNCQRCDGHPHCLDSSDELGCNSSSTCPNGYMTCDSGLCVATEKWCDGFDDCMYGLLSDHSDEENCQDYSCLEGYFKCAENGHCISMRDRCDYNPDCYDASDEEGCDFNECGTHYFRCADGRCLEIEYRCNGVEDCIDDEDSCDTYKCPDAYFTCLSGQCIPLTDRCDYNLECNDGSDEINCTKGQLAYLPVEAECPNGYFQCRSGQCVDLSKRCDSVADCTDAMDEFNCTGLEPPPIICEDNQFKCISVEKCINSSQVCNRVDNCGDKSDEVACMYTVECNMNEFKCDNDIDDFCIPRTWLCDRINQCGDGSDENECTYDVANVFSDSDWKAKYSDITNREDIYREFTQNVYSARNFDFIPSEDPPSWDHFLLASSTPDFTDLQDVLKLSSPELSIMGHQIDDFILQCTYDKKKCNLSEFYEFQHDKYGNCFTFNHGFDTKIRQATKSGADYGLKLTLFTEQNEYISLFGQQSGVRVVIHNPSTKPFPEDEGVYVKPGAVTAVSIKQNEWTRKGPPFGNCSTHFPESDVKYNYSSLACQKQCLQDYLFSKCGCVDTLSDDKPRCSVLNKTQDACKQLMNYFYREAMLSCDCQLPCREFSFSKTISQALWPSTTYLPHLLNSIHATNRKTWVIRDKESAREDLVRLEVYFEDLNIQLVSEEEAYPSDDGVPGHAAFRSSWLYENKGFISIKNQPSTKNVTHVPSIANKSDRRGQYFNKGSNLKTISDITRDFAMKTTSHGVARIAQAGTRGSKLLWACVVAAAFCAFTGQFVALVVRYLEYPVNINIGVVSRNTLPFPAVTICNTNKVRKSAVLESRYNALLDIDDFAERRGYLTYIGPCMPGDVPCDVDENQCVKSYMKCNGVNDCANGGDEADCDYGECFEGEFQCPNGKCIPASSQCDYRNDCEDNTDEKDCVFPSCAADEFTCTNHQCISPSILCDGIADCYDGSDEVISQHCLYPNSVCPADYFRCINGECIHYTLRCNMFNECSDHSDEAGCDTNVCPENFYRCRLLGQCIPSAAYCDHKSHCLDHTDEYPCLDAPLLQKRCDGVPDCEDGSDESWCDSTRVCPDGFTVCNSGRCIPTGKWCDGLYDCYTLPQEDYSDELNCENYTCLDGYFKCADNRKCVDMERRCDNQNDCSDGSDEVSCDSVNTCGPHHFRCRDGQCIQALYRCDGLLHCVDDEDNCDISLEPPPIICEDNQFTCVSVDKCINSSQVCNRVDDCGDKSDEVACVYSVDCDIHEFKCEGDKEEFCLPRMWLCDRINQCGDGSDEKGCVYGFKLTLFTEQNEYISLFGQQSGVRVVIHNPSTKPFPEDEGVYVKPGAVNAIAIRKNERTRKSSPFGKCESDSPTSDVDYRYSSLACQKQCLQDYLFSKCSCVDTLSVDKPRCSVLNKTQEFDRHPHIDRTDRVCTLRENIPQYNEAIQEY
uniref:Uncharacterized protein LOC102805083 n=1 Tax=Saccoglossus kowalevskii TaxID=10224 RepID=A0ABM0MBC5_SACKO|nr:PREDICTED: uncharacterized protein LOC102805083 [Saccoglossus kowalevskii]